MRNVVILGSTGSIGRQTLDVIRRQPNRIRLYGLAAKRNVELLRRQVEAFDVAVAVTGDDSGPVGSTETLQGEEGMVDLVQRPEVDLVVVATVGAAGLLPTIAALDAGKLVALANKETLVMAGDLIRQHLRERDGTLVPIDSEHSAIWQCIQGEPDAALERVTLTASGGALRHLSKDELANVTPEQALRHPTWSMGPKVTVDSATLLNKGLEVIEAKYLFDVPIEKVDVVMHPQSIVHSLVTFADSSVKAQLGLPDMRLPIQYALSHPDRWPDDLTRLNLAEVGSLTFAPVDFDRYPALHLAIEAGRAGNTYPAALCAADEVAVDAFLAGRIRFTDIPRVLEGVLEAHIPCRDANLDGIINADREARSVAGRFLSG